MVKPGGYSLTDKTYAELLHRLTRTPKQPIPPGIKSDVEAYYADPNAPIVTKQNPDAVEEGAGRVEDSGSHAHQHGGLHRIRRMAR